jgi:hypothetical protein
VPGSFTPSVEGPADRLTPGAGSDGGGRLQGSAWAALAADSVTAAWRTARATPAPFAAGVTGIMAVALLAGAAGSQVFALAAVPLAAAWAQMVSMRATLRADLAQDRDWRGVLRADAAAWTLLGTISLPQLCACMALMAVVFVERLVNHAMGGVSASLSLPLLLAPVLAVLAACARYSLAAAPAALGLAEPAAESWTMTRGRLAPLAGVNLIGVGPFVVAALAWPALAPGTAFGLLPLLVTSMLAVAAFGVQGSIAARLYERWRAPLRPDMRPSRHRSRRREPRIRANTNRETPMGETEHGFSHP